MFQPLTKIDFRNLRFWNHRRALRMLKLNSDDLVVCWPAGDVHAAGNCVQVAPALEVAVKPRGAAAGLTLEARVEGSVRRKRRGRENNRTWQKVNCTPFTNTDTAVHDSKSSAQWQKIAV